MKGTTKLVAANLGLLDLSRSSLCFGMFGGVEPRDQVPCQKKLLSTVYSFEGQPQEFEMS